MMTNPAKNNHNRITKITNTRSLGERGSIAVPSAGFCVSVIGIGTGEMVAVAVVVEAGKINVIAGRGIRVVVGVSDGVVVGVKVLEGVPCVSAGPG